MFEKNPHQDHRQRMKKRVRENGLDSLAEHEVLEYLLFYAIPRRDTNPIAHALIQRFGGFCQVMEAPPEELMEVEGIGQSTAEFLQLFRDVERYYRRKKLGKRVVLKNAENCKEYALALPWSRRDEMCYVVLLNDRLNPVETVLAGQGTPNKVRPEYDKILRAAGKFSATNAVMVHNHPAGMAWPSNTDILATKHMSEMLRNVRVTLLDHVIVADDEACSLRELGRMPLPEER